MKSIWLLAVICALTASAALGQRSDLSHEEYYGTIREANEKGRQASFRKTTKREYFEAGKATTSNDEILERLGPDRSRYFRSEMLNGKIESRESITIGKTYYCRENQDDWRISERDCGPTGFFAISPPRDQKFTVESVTFAGKPVMLYTDRSEFMDNSGPPEDGTKYWQHKYWINRQGLIVREEVDHGTSGSEKYRGRWLVTYDYAPKDLKIEPPKTANKPKP